MRLSLSTLGKTLLTAIAMMLWKAEARWGGGNSGGRAPVMKSDAPSSNLKAEQLEEAARKAANNIVVWGTTTLFQLKESAHMKKSMARSRASQGIDASQEGVKVDTVLSKQIVEGAIGGVLIMMNSPALGKMGDAIKRVMTDQRRQVHILQLHSQLREAHGANLGSGGPSKDPVGFWEGALRNKELAAAHDKYMSDVEALANSGLAKRAGESAEAYHEAMLKYASSESFQPAAKQ